MSVYVKLQGLIRNIFDVVNESKHSTPTHDNPSFQISSKHSYQLLSFLTPQKRAPRTLQKLFISSKLNHYTFYSSGLCMRYENVKKRVHR